MVLLKNHRVLDLDANHLWIQYPRQLGLEYIHECRLVHMVGSIRYSVTYSNNCKKVNYD